jgi:hypothetical protein
MIQMKPAVSLQDSKAQHATPRGIAAGTTVLTLDGELPVEFLSPGDRVITRDSGMAVLRDIRVRRVRCRAVAISAGSLGHTRPDEDMILPAAQRILVRDWRAEALFGATQALVPVARLADGQYIRDLGETEMVLHELLFDDVHVIYAGGMELDAPAVTETV